MKSESREHAAAVFDAINALAIIATRAGWDLLRQRQSDDELRAKWSESIDRWSSAIESMSAGPPGSSYALAVTELARLRATLQKVEFNREDEIQSVISTSRKILEALGLNPTPQQWDDFARNLPALD
jgi:hypothetical protein